MSEEGNDAAYRRLWASVIIQALIDATRQGTEQAPLTPTAAAERDQARAWFQAEVGTTAQNFEAVCLAAEFDPAQVRRFALTYEGPPLTVHTLSRLRDSMIGKQA